MEREIGEQRRDSEELQARYIKHAEALAETGEIQSKLEEECLEAERRQAEAAEKAQSMVTVEVLERVNGEVEHIQVDLRERENETSRLRKALADTWAARFDESRGNSDKSAENRDLAALSDVEEQLKWLTMMQQASQAEVHHVQQLERTEAALQAKLRAKSEEKAALLSARIDLGDASHAMREAIASQSEGFVTRVGDLAEARRVTDKDRTKLAQACADLQSKVQDMSPDLESVVELENEHARLEKEQRSLLYMSERLRLMNAALGAQLLGQDTLLDDGSGVAGIASAVARVLQLQQRLIDREVAHTTEKQKLADKIRTLEREGAQGCVVASGTVSSKGCDSEAKADESLKAGVLASATSALRGLLVK